MLKIFDTSIIFSQICNQYPKFLLIIQNTSKKITPKIQSHTATLPTQPLQIRQKTHSAIEPTLIRQLQNKTHTIKYLVYSV